MEKVRIQDDLYTYVNQEKLEELVIPDDQPATGGFNILAKDVEKIMIDEFKEMSEKGEYPNDYLKNACTLFKVIQNVEKREKDGIAPALNNLKSLNELKDILLSKESMAVRLISTGWKKLRVCWIWMIPGSSSNRGTTQPRNHSTEGDPS